MINYESQLVRLDTLETSFQYFITDHWTPLQYLILSLHESICTSCEDYA